MRQATAVEAELEQGGGGEGGGDGGGGEGVSSTWVVVEDNPRNASLAAVASSQGTLPSSHPHRE